MNTELKLTKDEAEKKHRVGLNKLLRIRLANSVFAGVLTVTGLSSRYFFPEQVQFSELILAIGATFRASSFAKASLPALMAPAIALASTFSASMRSYNVRPERS